MVPIAVNVVPIWSVQKDNLLKHSDTECLEITKHSAFYIIYDKIVMD